ncbi:MAG TPA: peptide ABC transporter substrate-binding protein [Pseudonocardiaceae bacterium]|nr:peptide ABC transporter substrate-binding protein [Pseudonocardiaceae bacterium]
MFARLPQRLALLLSVVALLPITLTTAAAHAAAAPSRVLRVGITQDIDSLNPFLAELASSTDLGRVMYEFLTTYDPKDEHPVPGLATSWTHSADGRTWTYTIRTGATWSDGVPITAADAAFTFNLMMTNKDAATANGNFVANFASVTAPNATTLVIDTKAPQATMLALDVPIVPKHVWSGVGDIAKYTNLPTPGHPTVGSGPYLLTDYREGQFVKLAANPRYWRGAAKIDELDFVHFDDTNAEVQALIKGDIDLVNGLTAAQFDSLKGHKGITTNQAVGGRFVDLVMNSGAATNTGTPIGDGNPNLKDIAVRTAIAQAIDPQTLVRQVYGGYAQVGTGYIPDKFATYHWNPDQQQAHAFNPTAANRALDAAGYPRGADGVRTGKDGKPLDLRLIGRTDKPEQTQMAAYLKSWLGAIGIGVNVQMVSSGKLDDVTAAGDFDLAFSGWGVDPDPDAVLALQTCGQRPDAAGQGASTEAFFCDPSYDSLYARQLSDMNPTARVSDVKKLESLFYQQVPEVTLVYPNVLEAYRSDRFAPFEAQPEPGGVIMAQNGYWGYYSATPIASATSSSGSGGNTGVIIAIVVVVVVLGGLGVFLGVRRRAGAADRE